MIHSESVGYGASGEESSGAEKPMELSGRPTASRPCRDKLAPGETARLIEPARRGPSTSVESMVVALLKREKEVPFETLVRRVADDLYRGEIRAGAWAVDIGLFGSSIFVTDALRELAAGNGELWEIGESVRCDGLLPDLS